MGEHSKEIYSMDAMERREMRESIQRMEKGEMRHRAYREQRGET